MNMHPKNNRQIVLVTFLVQNRQSQDEITLHLWCILLCDAYTCNAMIP